MTDHSEGRPGGKSLVKRLAPWGGLAVVVVVALPTAGPIVAGIVLAAGGTYINRRIRRQDESESTATKDA